jgi:hypothetical protein
VRSFGASLRVTRHKLRATCSEEGGIVTSIGPCLGQALRLPLSSLPWRRGVNKAIPAAWFVSYAGSDIGRWRELRGAVVEPRDAKWGAGTVRNVRWEARRGEVHPLGTVYAVVDYESGLRAQVNARAFAELHAAVSIPESLAALLREAFHPESPMPEAEREERFSRHDQQRIARRDVERTRRAQAWSPSIDGGKR